MDNLTHTLLGLLAGELVGRQAPARGPALPEAVRRGTCIALGVIGGNLPDADLLASYGGPGDGLRYLLVHRGHTHTLVGCALLALLLAGGALWWLRRRHGPLSPGDRWLVVGMSLLAVLLHLGMDALNSYGVHPFWPWDDRWYYGDAVFIIEPLYWLALAPLLFHQRSRAARLLLGLVLLAGAALQLVTHARAPWWAGVAALAVVLLAILGRAVRPFAAAALAAGLALGVTGVFVFASRAAQGEALRMAGASFPAARTVDQVLTPSPSDPGCWDLILVQDERGALVLRHGLLALGGGDGGAGAGRCRTLLPTRGAAPLAPVAPRVSDSVTWFGEVATPLDQLAQLAREHCDALNLLQFARAPFLVRREGRWLLGDLRFDRAPGAGMAKLLITRPPGATCLFEAPWVPPRAAELDAGSRSATQALQPVRP